MAFASYRHHKNEMTPANAQFMSQEHSGTRRRIRQTHTVSSPYRTGCRNGPGPCITLDHKHHFTQVTQRERTGRTHAVIKDSKFALITTSTARPRLYHDVQ